jgi:phosphomannomutase/phosphoglucomutase
MEGKVNAADVLHIFRAYDVRGVYGKDLSDGVAQGIGAALAEFIGEGRTVCVARDYRNSSNPLKAAFLEGALSSGANVVDLGVMPVPMFYFAIIAKGFDGGAMITASHNPPIWNGFKLCKENAESISEGDGMERLKELFASGAHPHQKGEATSTNDIVELYYSNLTNNIKLGRKLKIVVDPGNGAWSGIARDLFARLGCDVVEINGKPDGNFPGRGPDPNEHALEGLKRKVLEERADFGVGLDGDGDRAGFVDDKGRYVGNGSILLSIFAKYYLKENKNGRIVYDVPCSSAVEDIVNAAGGVAIFSKTGHTNIPRKMAAESAILGGEYSNHLYFSDNHNLDDGFYAAAKMAEVLSNSAERLSAMADLVPHYPGVPIEEISCPDAIKFKAMEGTKARFALLGFERIIDIDGVKAFRGDGWVLVRASNTMPQIKINAEAREMKIARELFELAKGIVSEEIAKLSPDPSARQG